MKKSRNTILRKRRSRKRKKRAILEQIKREKMKEVIV